MQPTEPDLRLIEPPSPEGLMPAPVPWETWCFIGVCLLVLMLITFFIWRRLSRVTTVTTGDVRSRAHREALAALSVCPTTNRTVAATESSIILRRYLSQITADPALYETHEEWVARHNSIRFCSAALKSDIHQLFSRLALFKYAPADQGDEPEEIISNSRRLLETIHREVTQ